MALTKAQWDIDPKLFEKAGVNIHDPKLKELKEQRDKQMYNKFNRELQKNKTEAVWHKSLWSSGEIVFNFKDWKPDERENPQQARFLGRKAFNLSKEMVNGHLNVVMSGDAGVGKTSLALAMLNLLRHNGKQVLFVSTVALSELVSQQYEYKDKKERLQSLKRAMDTCDVLLLDDLGADGGSIERVSGDGYIGARKDVQALLFSVANNRYEGTEKERKQADKKNIKLIKPVHQTIITTNNTTDELIRIYGERTISRLVTRDPNHRLPFNEMDDMRIKEGI